MRRQYSKASVVGGGGGGESDGGDDRNGDDWSGGDEGGCGVETADTTAATIFGGSSGFAARSLLIEADSMREVVFGRFVTAIE